MLQKNVNIRWAEVISSHEGIIVEFKRGKWKLVGRSLRKANRSVDRNALDWGPQEKEQRNIKKLERER